MRLDIVERGAIPKLKVANIPTLCQHCDNPPCLAAATGGAVYKRSDGLVIIDPEKSKGQKQIVGSCPYAVIYWNDVLNIPQKCDGCAHLLDKGRTEPRCVKACPTAALSFGDIEDLNPTIQQNGAVQLHPEFGAKPIVYYIGLPKTFIAGSLIEQSTGECMAGAQVSATDTASGKAVAATKSDNFGDFWLDGLDAKKSYTVTITKPGGASKTVSVQLDKDTDLGDITL